MKTAPTNKKIRELISMVKEGKIMPRPEFQRRLVWTRQDKNHFLDSILKGYPFPEIYLADGHVDLETAEGTQLLVDGLQRVNTLTQYFSGDPDLKLTTVPNYRDLEPEVKQAFLQYDVSVRDLGAIGKEEIVEIFKRINATKYALTDIEVNNAVYTGALKKFAEELALSTLFSVNRVFSTQDLKRMADLRYTVGITIALLEGYSNRDDAFGDFLERFNDDFPDAPAIKARLDATFDFINECGFEAQSRIWRKADLFTAIVEIDRLINVEHITIQPSDTLARATTFFASINTSSIVPLSLPGMYYKATVQASNDRVNRVRRGIIFSGVITDLSDAQIVSELVMARLLQ